MKRKGGTQCLKHFLYRIAVMRTIDDNGWIVSHHFNTSGPVYRSKSATERGLIPQYTFPAQFFKGCQCNGRILQLIAPNERYFKISIGMFGRPDGKALPLLVVGH